MTDQSTPLPADHTSTPRLDLDRYIPALITFLANKLSSGASSCYRSHFGIGIVEWRLLALLAVEHGITANRMCHVIGLDKAAVSRALKQMETMELIFTSPDPDDARRTLIELTPAGQQLHDRIIKVALARENLLLGDLSEAEIDVLINLLSRLNARIDLVNGFIPDHP